MAVKQAGGGFLGKLETDKRMIKLDSMLESGAYAINTSVLLTELDGLMETRHFRAYDTKIDDIIQNSQKKLISASVQNSSYRSRVVAIKIKCFRIIRLLMEHIETTSDYLQAKYADELKADYGTVDQRRQAVKFSLERLYKKQHKLQTVITICDELVKDLDSSGWALKSVIDILTISAKPERHI